MILRRSAPYRAAMEKFASDQLEMGRFTDDLAVLYRTFLRKSMLTRQMGEQLIRLLLSYEVTCTSPGDLQRDGTFRTVCSGAVGCAFRRKDADHLI